jgi:hypothetical protein
LGVHEQPRGCLAGLDSQPSQPLREPKIES